MFLAAQYYRAPFPKRRFWADDFSKIRDAGMHAVQLWCIWGWVESQPGTYNYDDYDELVALAEKKGLKIVISTIAEMHPFWINRLAPGSELVDHLGHKVISAPRGEVNVAVTPGGCFDHPRVAELMRNFLVATAGRYAGAKHLLGWDCWNEIRWTVHAEGHTCYCPNTLREFRSWLNARYGGLEGLSQAWERRYASWDDVMPGKKAGLPYSESMDFQRFLAERTARHAGWRYDAIRSADKTHMISAHCAIPAVQSFGWEWEQPLSRGVDHDMADRLDGFGSSHFPFWGKDLDEVDMGVRLEAVRSANQGKVHWMSEMHGGSARNGIMAHGSVPGKPQQRCVAAGMARGAKGVIFWCWRDEIFGNEASGFGLSGWDGLAEERLAEMKRTGKFIDKNDELIEAYQPAPAKVGVLFTPDNTMLKWAETGNSAETIDGINGYAQALERLHVPYEIVEAHHLAALDTIDVLLMPWSLVIPPATREAIVTFLQRGGRILCEAETDAFTETGFYRYPDERPLMKAIGVHDLGRRKLPGDPALPTEIDGQVLDLIADNFTTPLHAPKAAVLARNECDQPLMVRQPVGEGAAFVVGTFLGRTYKDGKNPDLEKLILHVMADAGVKPSFTVDAGDGNELLQWRAGTSGKARLLWLINGLGDRDVTITGAFGPASSAIELVSGKKVSLTKTPAGKQGVVHVPDGRYALLKW